MTQLLVPIHQAVEIPLDRLPQAACWEKLSPYWPAPADRSRAGQWEAKVRLFRYLAKAWVAISDDSYRALCTDLHLFFTWCRARDLAALPAAPSTVAAFVEDQAAVKAKGSVRRYLASIAKAHRHADRHGTTRHRVMPSIFASKNSLDGIGSRIWVLSQARLRHTCDRSAAPLFR